MSDYKINVRQLRIGSHVEVNGVRARVEMLRYVRLSTCDSPHAVFSAIVDGKRGECGSFLDDDIVNPIPITPELLADLGFEADADLFTKREKTESDNILSPTYIGLLKIHDELYRAETCNGVTVCGNMIVRYLHELETFVYLTLATELIEE